MKTLYRIIIARKIFQKITNFFLKIAGLSVLDLKETLRFSKHYEVSSTASEMHHLPKVSDFFVPEKIYFSPRDLVISANYVWDYRDKEGYLSKYGSVIIDKKVLCTHWTHDGLYRSLSEDDDRKQIACKILVAPFSHFKDERVYYGYYDYVFFIAGKLARIKNSMPDYDFDDIWVSYASFGEKYESEYLKLIGYKEKNFIDCQQYKPISKRILSANFEGWHPSKSDIDILKQEISKRFTPEKSKSQRIYISRSGRRKISNEVELIELLKEFDFKIIEDVERSVEEQIALYKNASFIVGAHGASFTNIIWCEPGTQLFELFSPNYAPDFFLYLAEVMELKYSAYYHGMHNKDVTYAMGLTEDIDVSIPELRERIKLILNSSNVT
ncbi:glycosyltransferase family 61 protein [Pedobacter aquatilis]|uniref:glycosyltransferase family 61 protein n=1 Tax=Pedobacter aquatilis TaxID=351343 RepID=UPI002930114E|nr:glycosyltransferase family 61 protein [Pedobacter aquatilis]